MGNGKWGGSATVASSSIQGHSESLSRFAPKAQANATASGHAGRVKMFHISVMGWGVVRVVFSICIGIVGCEAKTGEKIQRVET